MELLKKTFDWIFDEIDELSQPTTYNEDNLLMTRRLVEALLVGDLKSKIRTLADTVQFYEQHENSLSRNYNFAAALACINDILSHTDEMVKQLDENSLRSAPRFWILANELL